MKRAREWSGTKSRYSSCFAFHLGRLSCCCRWHSNSSQAMAQRSHPAVCRLPLEDQPAAARTRKSLSRDLLTPWPRSPSVPPHMIVALERKYCVPDVVTAMWWCTCSEAARPAVCNMHGHHSEIAPKHGIMAELMVRPIALTIPTGHVLSTWQRRHPREDTVRERNPCTFMP